MAWILKDPRELLSSIAIIECATEKHVEDLRPLKKPYNVMLQQVFLYLHNHTRATRRELVSFVLTGHHAFVTAAGYIGPKVRVDHDVSLLIPEVWCRMKAEERDARFLIAGGYLERCRDFVLNELLRKSD